MTGVDDLIGIPHAAIGCYELSRAVCARFGRRVPELGAGVLERWRCGADMSPHVPVDLEPVPIGSEEPGDLVLMEQKSGAVTNVAPVIRRGVVLATGEGRISAPIPIADVEAEAVRIVRLPAC